MIKALPDAADGARVRLYGFGLRAFEFQVFRVLLVVAVKQGFG
jgi:hypothetical protein